MLVARVGRGRMEALWFDFMAWTNPSATILMKEKVKTSLECVTAHGWGSALPKMKCVQLIYQVLFETNPSLVQES